MKSNQHYDDERIMGFLDRLEVAGQDPHLASCPRCAGMLEEYRVVEKTLGKAPVWDLRELKDEPVPATIATLRAFAGTMAREDAEADANLTRLLEGPREWWSNRLRQNPQWRTAGMVRRLIAATDRAIDTMPPDAVEITALAVDIAEGLEPAGYPSDTVAKLRGAAWRERGYALFYVGRFNEALVAVDRSEVAFKSCIVSDYDLARTDVMRAILYRTLQRVDDALLLVRNASSVFMGFEDYDRAVPGRSVEASLWLDRGDYRTALRLWQQLEAELRPDDRHMASRALLLMNIALCHRNLGEIGQATELYLLAANLFTELGSRTEAARVRWNIVPIFVTSGRHDEALELLAALKDEFAALGMRSEAALTNLDRAEILISQNKFAEVEAICRDAMGEFETAGLQYTNRALTALAYLREATRRRVVTPQIARHVRSYIRRLPQEPDLLFALPPQ